MSEHFNFEITITKGEKTVVCNRFFAQTEDVAQKIARSFVKSLTAKVVNDRPDPLTKDMFKLYPLN